jgi:D-alanyl-D-alanine carboxypeptidase (penicillin-binding protein 5/6)
MPKSTFGNSTGLPHPDNMMTSRELAILAQYLMTRHAEFYPMFATKRFEFTGYESEWCAEWGRTHTMNYNKLLFMMPGAEGMKTGHTDVGGYGLVATANVGGRRLIGVINGLNVKSHDALAREMKKMLDFGYNNTTTKKLYSADDEIIRVPVWYGKSDDVVGTVARDFAATLPLTGGKKAADSPARGELKVIAKYISPLRAPIAAGQKLGEIRAEQNGRIIARAPIVARERVGRAWFWGRIIKNLEILF